MAKITEFPPQLTCERCKTPMRPSTRAELHADSTDARYRHVALLAAQGDQAFASTEDEDPLGTALASADGLIERPTWLMRCDTCGARVLWNRMEER